MSMADPDRPAQPFTDRADDARRRRIRTAVQAAVAACTVLLVIVPIVVSTLEQALPPRAYAALAAVALAITTTATVITRVMTHPMVARWIDTYLPWLSADSSPSGLDPDES
jgi:hypothetical protein